MKKITEYKILEDFLKYCSNLKVGDFSKKKLFDQDWITFNKNFAGSLTSFYKYNNKLYSKSNISYEDSRFYSFYTDHIIANPSSQIFTETPRSSSFDLFPIDSKIIASDANHIFKLVENNKKSIIDNSEFNKYFQKLYIETFCYFDFAFSVKEQEGVFTNFGYSKTVANKYSEILDSFINDKDIDFKHLLNKLKVINIDITMNLYNKINNIVYNKEYLESIIQHEIYTEYVKVVKKLNNTRERDKTIKFEIFTYVLSHKLWKIERIYHTTPEFKKEKANEIHKEFEEKTKKYINKQLKIIEQFYNKKITLGECFLYIYKSDNSYIKDYLFTNFLQNIEEDNESHIEFKGKELFDNKEVKYNGLTISQMINKYIVKNQEKEKFKFFRLIQSAEPDEIVYLLQYFYEYIKKETKDISNTSFLGVLRSGAFLAHALHILKLNDSSIINKYKNSYFMITYPYISIIPRNLINRHENNDLSIIYIDEAIKSGYSLAVADIYRKRVLKLKGLKKSEKDIAFALTNFIDYSDKIIDNNTIDLKYKTLANIKINKQKIEAVENNDEITIKKIFPWENFLSSLIINKEQIKEQALIKINDEDRYDLVKNLSDSKTLFSIAKFFYEQLISNINNKKEYLYVFYAGCPEGNLLIDTMVFIGKILYNIDNIEYILNGKSFHEKLDENKIIKTIFVDVSIITASTKNKVWNLDVSKYIKKRKKKEKFDYTCSIFNSANDKIKDIDIFVFDENKDNI